MGQGRRRHSIIAGALAAVVLGFVIARPPPSCVAPAEAPKFVIDPGYVATMINFRVGDTLHRCAGDFMSQELVTLLKPCSASAHFAHFAQAVIVDVPGAPHCIAHVDETNPTFTMLIIWPGLPEPLPSQRGILDRDVDVPPMRPFP